jgi:glycosyltransferase involved in cell wall biosynthesis
MTPSAPDITAVLNVHREGLLAHSSLQSMVQAREAAVAAGISVEILIAADCPDAATRSYLSIAPEVGAGVLELRVDDLGMARNAAVEAGGGRFFAFLDGDDLWCRDWLIKAYRCALSAMEPAIWHPEANLYFGPGGEPCWMMHHDIDTALGDWVLLGLRNHWTSLSFAPREVYERVPYRESDLNAGFGYEDWCWNAETVAHGYRHLTVLGAVHLIRMQAGSLARQANAVRALATPSSLLRKKIGIARMQE